MISAYNDLHVVIVTVVTTLKDVEHKNSDAVKHASGNAGVAVRCKCFTEFSTHTCVICCNEL